MKNFIKNKKYGAIVLILIMIAISTIVLTYLLKQIASSPNTETLILSILCFFIALSIFITMIYAVIVTSPYSKIESDFTIIKNTNDFTLKYKEKEIKIPYDMTTEKISMIELKDINGKKIDFTTEKIIKQYLIRKRDNLELYGDNLIFLKNEEAYKLSGLSKITEQEKIWYINNMKENKAINVAVLITGCFLIMIGISGILTIGFNLSLSNFAILVFCGLMTYAGISTIINQRKNSNNNKKNMVRMNEVLKTNVYIYDKTHYSTAETESFRIRVKDKEGKRLAKWFDVSYREYNSNEDEYMLYICKDNKTGKIYIDLLKDNK